jgi:hypothetical protein
MDNALGAAFFGRTVHTQHKFRRPASGIQFYAEHLPPSGKRTPQKSFSMQDGIPLVLVMRRAMGRTPQFRVDETRICFCEEALPHFTVHETCVLWTPKSRHVNRIDQAILS